MKVIVAGFSKTGTKTMNAALTKLGYNVYDFIEHFWYHEKYWAKIFKDGGSTDDFKEMYSEVDAIVDLPAFLFWEEISQAFPEAKIIFTTRDEESWTNSMSKQLYDVSTAPSLLRYLMSCTSPTARRLKGFMTQIMNFAFGQEFSPNYVGKQPNKLLLRKRYQQYNAYFLQNAPKDKLLVFDIKEGWRPLCRFLGKETPQTSFPWRNKGGKEVLTLMDGHPCEKQIKKEVLLIICFFVSMLAAFCIFFIQEDRY